MNGHSASVLQPASWPIQYLKYPPRTTARTIRSTRYDGRVLSEGDPEWALWAAGMVEQPKALRYADSAVRTSRLRGLLSFGLG